MPTGLRRVADLFLLKAFSIPFAGKLSRILLPAHCIVRPLDPDRDLEALAACGATLSSNRSEDIREDFRLEFADRDPRRWLFLIAEDPKSRVLGFVRAMRQGPEQNWWIVGLGVRPLYRRRGIGEALVSEMLTHLREREVSEVRLEVNQASRPAVGLYRKLGFEEAGTGERADQGFLRMVLNLYNDDSANKPHTRTVLN
jgi:ribosomal protein S18 acetylase RimI-like enzyme